MAPHRNAHHLPLEYSRFPTRTHLNDFIEMRDRNHFLSHISCTINRSGGTNGKTKNDDWSRTLPTDQESLIRTNRPATNNSLNACTISGKKCLHPSHSDVTMLLHRKQERRHTENRGQTGALTDTHFCDPLSNFIFSKNFSFRNPSNSMSFSADVKNGVFCMFSKRLAAPSPW